MADYLTKTWGLSSNFSVQIALFYAYLFVYGLNPQITSGYRDPAHQKALQAKFDSGNIAGIAVRPASDSLHSRATGIGSPASLAIDISVSDYNFAGQIAEYLGIGWGGRFSTPDLLHFYDKKALGGL